MIRMTPIIWLLLGAIGAGLFVYYTRREIAVREGSVLNRSWSFVDLLLLVMVAIFGPLSLGFALYAYHRYNTTKNVRPSRASGASRGAYCPNCGSRHTERLEDMDRSLCRDCGQMFS